MTEALNTTMNDSTHRVYEKSHISKERAHNIRAHLIPLVGGITLAATLASGAAYELGGPTKEVGTELGTITAGHGISDAAEQARLDFQAKTGIELPYSDVYGASQVTHGIADKDGIVQPGNIELIVKETPLLHRHVVTIASAHSSEK